MTSNPYDRPSDPAKRKSAALTDGPDRAGARSMLKGTGFTDDDLAKPIIGVATTWIETMPCNLNQRDLAVHVKRGIRDAGATPMEFNTIAVSDGVSMGTSGMRASLVSREVIADSIELVARGHLFDGLVCLVACDKTTPGAIMALGRLDIPAVVFYTGSIAPGLYRGREVSIGDVYEAIGAYAAGKMSAEELHELESVACPAAGACGGQFTANTMSTMVDFLGLTPLGANGIPAVNGAKAEAAYEIGTLAVDVVRRDLRPSQVVTKEAIENAAAAIAGTGGSTNGVLHLVAIAHEFGIDFTIDDFDRISAATPIVADMKPWGRYHATDVYRAGGVGLVARELRKGSLVHAGVASVDGRTLTDVAESVEETAGQTVVVPFETPLKSRGGVAILRGNLAPEGCVVKLAGHDRMEHRGPARVFDSEEDVLRGGEGGRDRARRRGRDPLRGPGRRTGNARDAARHGRDRRRGARGVGRPRHRRPLLRRDPRLHGRTRRRRRRSAAARSRRSRTATPWSSTSRRASCGSSSPTTSSPRASPTGRRPRRATRTACSRSTRRSSRPRPRARSRGRRRDEPHDRLDLDRRAERQGRDSDRRAGVLSAVAERREEHLGRTVRDDVRTIEAGRSRDEDRELHEPLDPVQPAGHPLELSEDVPRTCLRAADGRVDVDVRPDDAPCATSSFSASVAICPDT